MQDKVEAFNMDDIQAKPIQRKVPQPSQNEDFLQQNQDNNDAEKEKKAKDEQPVKEVGQSEDNMEVIEADLDDFGDLE